MANNAETDGNVPDDQVKSGDSEEHNPTREAAQGRFLQLLPMLLGVFIIVLNILVAIRLWRTVYDSKSTSFERLNLPTTVFLTLITISFFLGLFLLAYTLVLRHSEKRSRNSKPTDEVCHTRTCVQWIIVPLLIALPAPALTVWAAQTIEPINPRPCMELYQEAQSIKNDNPGFRMTWTDRDQRRCAINQAVLTK